MATRWIALPLAGPVGSFHYLILIQSALKLKMKCENISTRTQLQILYREDLGRRAKDASFSCRDGDQRSQSRLRKSHREIVETVKAICPQAMMEMTILIVCRVCFCIYTIIIHI